MLTFTEGCTEQPHIYVTRHALNAHVPWCDSRRSCIRNVSVIPTSNVRGLSGLFLVSNKDQSEEDSKVAEEFVLSYMMYPRTIILAVVSAKSDFALQQVTRHARAQDPGGIRTLGLITKPDTLDAGSESERFYLELAQNKDVKFQLGWHVLRNRSYSTHKASTMERDRAEVDFFAKSVWNPLKASQTVVAALRLRPSKVLRDHILKRLAQAHSEIQKGIEECERTLGSHT